MAIFDSMTDGRNRLILLNFCGNRVYEAPKEAAGKGKRWQSWCSFCERQGKRFGVSKWRLCREEGGWQLTDSFEKALRQADAQKHDQSADLQRPKQTRKSCFKPPARHRAWAADITYR